MGLFRDKKLLTALLLLTMTVAAAALSSLQNIPVSLTVASRQFTVTTSSVPIYEAGNTVTISGQASFTDGAPVTGAPVTVQIQNGAFQRSLTGGTNSSGGYSVSFVSLQGLSGEFLANSSVTSNGLTKTANTSFSVEGLTLTPSFSEVVVGLDANITQDLTLSNAGDLPISGITATCLTVNGSGISCVLKEAVPSSLGSNSSATVSLLVIANSTASGSGDIALKVGNSQYQNLTEAQVHVSTQPEAPLVSTEPSQVQVSLAPGTSDTVTIQVKNAGLGPATGVSVSKPSTQLVNLMSNTTLGTIQPSGNANVTLLFSSTSTTLTGLFHDSISISGNNFPSLSVPITIGVTNNNTGQVSFETIDEFAEPVQAIINLISNGTFVASGTTDTNGHLNFTNVPIGLLNYIAEAQNHQTVSGSTQVEALSNAPVTVVMQVTSYLNVAWTVLPTTINDSYVLSLNLTYQTKVLKPYIIAVPQWLDFGLTHNNDVTGTLTLDNPSQIAIFGIRLTSNINPDLLLSFETNYIPEIPAGGHVDLPYLARLGPDADLGKYFFAQLVGNVTFQGSYVHFDASGSQEISTSIQTTVDAYLYDARRLVVSPSFYYDFEVDNPGLCWYTANDANSIPSQVLTNITNFNTNILAIDRGGEGVTLGPVYGLETSIFSYSWGIDLQALAGDAASVIPGGSLIQYLISLRAAGPSYFNTTSLQDGMAANAPVPPFYGEPNLGCSLASINLNVGGFWFTHTWASGDTHLDVIPLFIATLSIANITFHYNFNFNGGGLSGLGFGPGGRLGGIATGGLLPAPLPPSPVITSSFPGGVNTGCFPCPGSFPTPYQSVDLIDEVVKLSISQTLTLERQAFIAKLQVRNVLTSIPISNFNATLEIRDQNNMSALNQFDYKITNTQNLNVTGGKATLLPGLTAEIDWIIIPRNGAGGVLPSGRPYGIAALMTYSILSHNITQSTLYDQVTVYPQPQLVITYYVPRQVGAGVEFPVGVTITNIGYGPARELTLTSMQPSIWYNPSGLAVSFTIVGVVENGVFNPNLILTFPIVPAGQTVTGEWIMVASLPGNFTEMSATYTHVPFMGIVLSPLVESVTVVPWPDNVALLSFTLPTTTFPQNSIAVSSLTVTNDGSNPESVIATITDTSIMTLLNSTTISLEPGQTIVVNLSWNNSLLSIGNRTITASISIQVTQKNTSANQLFLNVEITGPGPASDFAISISPVSITTIAGTPATSTITVFAVNGSGTVNIMVTTNSTNLSCTLSPTSIIGGFGTSTLTCSANVAGNYSATVTGTSGTFSHSVTGIFFTQDFTVTASPTSVNAALGAAGTSTITVSPINGFLGAVSLTVAIPANLTCSLSSTTITSSAGTSTLSCTASATGSFIVGVAGTSGTDEHFAFVTYTVTSPGFTITASPTSVTVNVRADGKSTINLTSLQGFTGIVTLTTDFPPNGTCMLSPVSVTLVTNANTTLSCNSLRAESDIVTVTACSGTICNSTQIAFHFVDFSLSASPNNITATGLTATSQINASPLNGFTGSINLTSSISPQGLLCSFTPAALVLGPSQTSTLSCNGKSGIYDVTINATSGSLSHTTTVSVAIGAGIICLVPSGQATCESTPIAITGPVGGQLALSVLIQNSTGLDGFDITILADHSVLQPVAVSLSHTVLPGTPTIIEECLGGKLIVGTFCPTTDTIDTAQFVAVGGLGSVTGTPTTGILFTVLYNVTTSGSDIPLTFQTGCSNTSVLPNVCVSIANGSTSSPLDPETVQAATFSTTSPVSTTNWTQFQSGPEHDGYSGSAGPTTFNQIWNYSLGGSYDGIVQTNGLLIVTSPDQEFQYFYALNQTTGSPIYVGYTAHTISGNPTSVSTFYPATGAGRIYLQNFCIGCFLSEGPWFVADNVTTGNNVWQLSSPGFNQLSAIYGNGFMTYVNGSLYIALYQSTTLYDYNATTGALIWQQPNLSGGPYSMGTPGDGLFVIGSTPPSTLLTALSESTGAIKWTFSADGWIPDPPAFSDGFFYFASSNGTVYKVSPQGLKVWSTHVDTGTGGVPGYARIEASPAVTSGLVYVGAGDGFVYCLNATDGSLVWRVQTDGSIYTSAAVSSNGFVYEGSENGTLYAIDALKGSLIWQAKIGIAITSSFVLSNGFLYAVNSNGVIFAIADSSISPSATLSAPSSEELELASSISPSISGPLQEGSMLGTPMLSEAQGPSKSPEAGLVSLQNRTHGASLNLTMFTALVSASFAILCAKQRKRSTSPR